MDFGEGRSRCKQEYTKFMILSYKNTIQWIRNEVYAHITIYYRYWRCSRKLRILNSEDTLRFILNHRVSVCRFGDGEIMVMYGEGNGMQAPNSKLSKRLKEVFLSSEKNIMIAIPYGWKSKKKLRKSNRMFWTYFIAKYGNFVLSLNRSNRNYLNASYTRFYMDSTKKHTSSLDNYITAFRRQWKDKDVYMIEGDGTRFGVGNDFLDNARSVHRIVCPSTNAFDRYEIILAEAKRNIPSGKNVLILCALGMTATVLAYDLAMTGYQVLDIGHADIEYSWYKMNVEEKVPITGKTVNELNVNYVPKSNNPEYLNEIIARII